LINQELANIPVHGGIGPSPSFLISPGFNSLQLAAIKVS
jgi:hypothetical protein